MSSFTGTALQADSVHFSSTTGTFVSTVLDAGRQVAWGTASWNASIPAGAGLVIEVSSGNSPVPDGTWSAWSVLTNSGDTVLAPAGRYLRYRVTFTASASGATPVLQDMTITAT
jgi:hypothetical protein